MALDRLVALPLVISLLSSVVLLGCQTTASSKSTTTVSAISPKDKPNPTDKTVIKKALPASTELPITNELLEQYHWQLVSAVSHNLDDNGKLIREPMGNFYHPDYPVSVRFRSDPDSQYVSYSSDCNGSGAPYTLLKNNTLKVGSIVSTDMGCSETSNRIENALFNLMGNSSSKLTLSLQSAKAKSETPADFPRYNLLQTMDSGETLVWQNALKDQR